MGNASRTHAAVVTCLVGLASATLVFWRSGNCLGAFFHFDDFWVLRAASEVNFHSLDGLSRIFAPVNGFLLYRPLSTVGYFALLRSLFGHEPAAYHAAQLASQVCAAVLVFRLAACLLEKRPLAVVAALLYAAAPGHAIAACWNALFTMTGASLFYLAGLHSWLVLSGRRRSLTSVLFFLLAVLSSEHGITFPLALTAATFLLESPPRWRECAGSLAVMYLGMAAYIGAKLYHLHIALPASGMDPLVLQLAQSAYRPELDALVWVRNWGHYVGFSFNGLMGVTAENAGVCFLLGFMWLLSWGIAVGFCLLGNPTRELRAAAFGLTLFGLSLAPVAALPNHVFSYYIGIAAAGLVIGLLAGVNWVLHRPKTLAAVAVGMTLWLLPSTTERLRAGPEFAFFWSFSESAARWLHTLAIAGKDPGVSQVVVPADGLTDMVFREGEAHRVLLCGTYDVQREGAIQSAVPGFGRVVVREPLRFADPEHHSWSWLPRECP